MARPTKQGVDYFPLDVHMDDKFRIVESRHGLEGFAITIKLMQKIYSQGYYTEWDNDIEELFASETRVEVDKLKAVLSSCLDKDIFDKKLFEEYSILTSKGIQKRYKEIVRRRKDVEEIKEYLLIDTLKPQKRNKKQEKKEETPEKKENNVWDLEDDPGENGEKTPIDVYQENYGMARPATLESIVDWEDRIGKDLVIAAIKKAAKNGWRSYSAIENLIREWLGAGVVTVEDANAFELSRLNSSRSKSSDKIESLRAYAERG